MPQVGKRGFFTDYHLEQDFAEVILKRQKGPKRIEIFSFENINFQMKIKTGFVARFGPKPRA